MMKLDKKKLGVIVDEFIGKIQKAEVTPTMERFALYAGISKETLYRYRKNPIHSDSIKKLELACESAIQTKLLMDNKPVGAIFMLKAKYGYSDMQKVDITTNGESIGIVMLPNRA
jgi:hypothetical protein